MWKNTPKEGSKEDTQGADVKKTPLKEGSKEEDRQAADVKKHPKRRKQRRHTRSWCEKTPQKKEAKKTHKELMWKNTPKEGSKGEDRQWADVKKHPKRRKQRRHTRSWCEKTPQKKEAKKTDKELMWKNTPKEGSKEDRQGADVKKHPKRRKQRRQTRSWCEKTHTKNPLDYGIIYGLIVTVIVHAAMITWPCCHCFSPPTISPEVFQLYGLGGLELVCNGPWLQLSGAWLPGGVASCPPMTQWGKLSGTNTFHSHHFIQYYGLLSANNALI